MKEWCHKQSRLTVPALCQSQITASAASLSLNELNPFPSILMNNYIIKKYSYKVEALMSQTSSSQ